MDFWSSGTRANRKDIFAVPGRMEPTLAINGCPHTYIREFSIDGKHRIRNDKYCCRLGYELWYTYEDLIDKPFMKAEKDKIRKRIEAPCGTNHELPKGHHKGNGKPKGIFAGTLTMSPKWETNEEEMVTAIKKLMRQKTCPVKRYVWYLEYTQDNVPHIHFIYETDTGGRITQQTFKRQWKYWDESTPCGGGHVGGYHKHCAKEDDYLEYISKDKGRHENTWTTKQ